MTTPSIFFTSRTTSPAMVSLLTGFFGRSDIVDMCANPKVDYNRIFCMLKEYVLASDLYTEPREKLDELIKRFLDPRTKWSNSKKAGEEDDDGPASQVGKKSTVSRTQRDTFAKLQVAIGKKQTEMAKMMKCGKLDEDSHAMTQVLMQDLSALYDTEARLLDEVVGDGSPQAYRRHLNEITNMLITMDYDARGQMRERQTREQMRRLHALDNSDHASSGRGTSPSRSGGGSSPARSTGELLSPNTNGVSSSFRLPGCALPLQPPLQTSRPTATPPSLTCGLTATPSSTIRTTATPPARYMMRTTIRVELLRLTKADWFRRDVDMDDLIRNKGAIAPYVDMDINEFMRRVAELSITRPSIAHEVRSLLSLIYETSERQRTSFLEYDSSSSSSDTSSSDSDEDTKSRNHDDKNGKGDNHDHKKDDGKNDDLHRKKDDGNDDNHDVGKDGSNGKAGPNKSHRSVVIMDCARQLMGM